MDGYALGKPAGNTWRLVGQVPAGHPAEKELLPGQAARIFTGAALPGGTWAVISGEEAAVAGEEIRLLKGTGAGANIEQAGSEVRAGEIILEAGTSLGPAESGLLAALGVERVRVYRRPRVALICTGSELRLPGQALEYGQVYASNLAMLAAACLLAGAEVIYRGVAADDLQQIFALMERALPGADLLLISGGAAGSEYDFTSAAFRLLGGEILFQELAIRPGRKVVAGALEKKLLLGLPGRPPAALAAFYLVAVPVLRFLAGLKPGPEFFTAILTKPLKGNPRPSRKFIWAKLSIEEGRLLATPLFNPEGICAAIGADALVEIPPHCPDLHPGSRVRTARLPRHGW
ncbi:MAG: molybdopterin molybdotransferase [Clostridia bacterium]|nr:molybdopterin molybdotransferase [Clostridia bacterium]